MPETLQLDEVHFVAGSKPGEPSLTVSGNQTVVLVGPNNSGKSTALRELDTWASGEDTETRVISGAKVRWPDADDAFRLIKTFEAEAPSPMPMDTIYFSVTRPGKSPLGLQASHEEIARNLETQNERAMRHQLLQPFTLRLDGRGRFGLADPQDSGDLSKPAQNHLWRLLQSENSRQEVRRLVRKAFGYYFFVDMTGLKELRIRMAEEDPPPGFDEVSVRQESLDFANASPQLSELGDGVQAYTGLVSAIVGIPSRLILIDEPEAFLHPLLSRRLGGDLTRLIRDRDGTLVVSTHSPDFLMGCLEESDSSAIVRLTFERGMATARSLDSSVVASLMRDPMLRSTGALSGLFHRAVVIVEGDSDRAAYSEINRRLDSAGRGIDDCLFLNAQNWQTIPKLVGPLRDLGIPAAAIVDLDAIRSPQKWVSLFTAAGMDLALRDTFNARRDAARKILKTEPASRVKKEGLGAFSKKDRKFLEGYLEELAEYGIFVVPVGVLESWLKELEIPSGKSKWVAHLLERLGTDRDSPTWVEPEDSDVWAFIDRISRWVADPDRRGIPDQFSPSDADDGVQSLEDPEFR